MRPLTPNQSTLLRELSVESRHLNQKAQYVGDALARRGLLKIASSGKPVVTDAGRKWLAENPE